MGPSYLANRLHLLILGFSGKSAQALTLLLDWTGLMFIYLFINFLKCI